MQIVTSFEAYLLLPSQLTTENQQDYVLYIRQINHDLIEYKAIINVWL